MGQKPTKSAKTHEKAAGGTRRRRRRRGGGDGGAASASGCRRERERGMRLGGREGERRGGEVRIPNCFVGRGLAHEKQIVFHRPGGRPTKNGAFFVGRGCRRKTSGPNKRPPPPSFSSASSRPTKNTFFVGIFRSPRKNNVFFVGF